jgi:hypothetical protein
VKRACHVRNCSTNRATTLGGAPKHIGEAVPLNGPIAEIESSEPPGEQYQQVTAVYWSVSHVTLEGVLDQVRTRLVELVAEMRAGMPDEADVPSSAVADNAVSVVIHGDKSRVSVTSASASRRRKRAARARTPSTQGAHLTAPVSGRDSGAPLGRNGDHHRDARDDRGLAELEPVLGSRIQSSPGVPARGLM